MKDVSLMTDRELFEARFLLQIGINDINSYDQSDITKIDTSLMEQELYKLRKEIYDRGVDCMIDYGRFVVKDEFNEQT